MCMCIFVCSHENERELGWMKGGRLGVLCDR